MKVYIAEAEGKNVATRVRVSYDSAAETFNIDVDTQAADSAKGILLECTAQDARELHSLLAKALDCCAPDKSPTLFTFEK